MRYGISYAIGSAEYCRLNNKKNSLKRENFWLSVVNESRELKEAILECSPTDIVLEASDVIHSISKYLILEFLPEWIYCNMIIWSFVFFFILPCSIKLGKRYRNFGCIRNHTNPNNRDHICNYKKSSIEATYSW